MTQRTTPQVPRTFTTKSTLVAAAIILAAASPIALFNASNVRADQYDTQKDALQGQIGEYQNQVEHFASQLDNLNAQLQLLETQKKQIQAEIALTQNAYDQLQSQIDLTNKDIKQNQDALGLVINQIYIQSRTSPLEMLASSKNIGDYVNLQVYHQSMQSSLTTTIDKIGFLKKSLKKKQDAVKVVLNKQKAQENDLAAREAQQNKLIADTKGQQNVYQQLINSMRDYMQSVSAQQRDYYTKVSSQTGGGAYGVHGEFSYSNWSGNQGCGGGYPYCAPQDTMADPWGLFNRECVSYVAWSLTNRYHRYVGNFNGQGNAGEWPSSAVRFSGATIVTDPKPGDAVILPATTDGFAPVGHAMIVDSVNGNKVHVSQFNFYGTGEYSTMDIGTGGVVFLRFPAA